MRPAQIRDHSQDFAIRQACARGDHTFWGMAERTRGTTLRCKHCGYRSDKPTYQAKTFDLKRMDPGELLKKLIAENEAIDDTPEFRTIGDVTRKHFGDFPSHIGMP